MFQQGGRMLILAVTIVFLLDGSCVQGQGQDNPVTLVLRKVLQSCEYAVQSPAGQSGNTQETVETRDFDLVDKLSMMDAQIKALTEKLAESFETTQTVQNALKASQEARLTRLETEVSSILSGLVDDTNSRLGNLEKQVTSVVAGLIDGTQWPREKHENVIRDIVLNSDGFSLIVNETKLEIQSGFKDVQSEWKDFQRQGQDNSERLKAIADSVVTTLGSTISKKVGGFKGMESEVLRMRQFAYRRTCFSEKFKPKPREVVRLQSGLRVLCDTETSGGGWIVIQRRLSGDVNFFRTWAEYKAGFGSLDSDFWMGNQQIHELTTSGTFELRVDFNFRRKRYFAVYSDFKVLGEDELYTLKLGNRTAGNAPEVRGMLENSDQPFSTKDRDNDQCMAENCALKNNAAGWWFNCCSGVNLNGLWGHRGTTKAMQWKSVTDWNHSATFTELKIRVV